MLVIARSASLLRLLTGAALTEPNGCGFALHPTVISSSFICSFPALSWPRFHSCEQLSVLARESQGLSFALADWVTCQAPASQGIPSSGSSERFVWTSALGS